MPTLSATSISNTAFVSKAERLLVNCKEVQLLPMSLLGHILVERFMKSALFSQPIYVFFSAKLILEWHFIDISQVFMFGRPWELSKGIKRALIKLWLLLLISLKLLTCSLKKSSPDSLSTSDLSNTKWQRAGLRRGVSFTSRISESEIDKTPK